MIVATYNIAQEHPIIYGVAPGKRRWLIKLFITNGEEKIEKEIRNKQPIVLSDLIKTANSELSKMWVELPGIIDAGFSVHLLR